MHRNRISIFNELRDRWKLPADLNVSQWADENRMLDPRSSAEPGQWSTSRTPYLKGIMDAFNDQKVRSITIMASTQIGKTEAMLNIFGYIVDQDPGPCLWVNTTEELAKSFCKHRIQPMVTMSQALTGHLTGNQDDLGKLEISFDRMPLFIAWSNSPAALSSRPIKYIFFDEVDKYPKFSGREADPIKLGEERTSTFWNHKVVKCSTPTTKEGYIYNDYLKTDRCQYHVPCPHCGHYQVLTFHQVMWPKEEFTTQELKDKRLAWYECLKCKGVVKDIHKNKMLQRGVWCPDACDVGEEGEIVGDIPVTTRRGFWINALYSPWLTFSDLAAEFLESKDQINDLMNFINSKLAEIWEEKAKKTDVDFVRALSLNYPEGLVEDQATVLTAGVDVQQDHFYFVIRAWGYGEESWLVRAARVESWVHITEALFETAYKKRNGEVLKVRMACLDSGYNTDEVYLICRRYSHVARAIKGDIRVTGVPISSPSRIDRYVGSGSVIPGGLSLYRLDVNYFKDKVFRLVHSEAGDLSKWHNFKNVSEQYLKQFCSEDKVILRDRKTGRAQEVWKPKANKTPNHYWDAEIYAVAAAEMIHVSSMRDPAKQKVHSPDREKESSYLGSLGQMRKNWLQQ